MGSSASNQNLQKVVVGKSSEKNELSIENVQLCSYIFTFVGGLSLSLQDW
jgi:hypothetical protein